MLRFKNRNHLYVVSVIFLFLFLAGCSNKPKELAPFFDGLFLKYTRESSIKREIAFNVEALSDGEFQIIETATPKLIGDKIDKMQVDRFGRVYKSTFEPYEGKFSPIWIPVTKLKINGKFDGRKKLVRIEPWREWEVAVVKDIPTLNHQKKGLLLCI